MLSNNHIEHFNFVYHHSCVFFLFLHVRNFKMFLIIIDFISIGKKSNENACEWTLKCANNCKNDDFYFIYSLAASMMLIVIN